jgi:sulfite reductase (NADPH) hemoprotein beta-component
MIAHKIRDFLPKADLLAYTNAILRVYNLEGRRDNKFKARIKILVHDKGADEMRAAVEQEFRRAPKAALSLPQVEIDRIRAYFAPPALPERPAHSQTLEARAARDPEFARFVRQNLAAHKVQGHTIVTISLKPIAGIPGDATADQMDAIAQLAETYGHNEVRVSHEQNLILPHVALDDVPAVFDRLVEIGLATANAGLVTDIIACPGLDYCSLATARSIPIAQRISERLGAPERSAEIGPLTINISGCINACGHHHVGHIGILGLEKGGVESYQITLGGAADEDCALGDLAGPGFSTDDIVDSVEILVDTYLELRNDKAENFLATYRRIGMAPFRKALYERFQGNAI